MDVITIKDIARMCGVGVSTVSRAINNHPDINPETRDMIMQTIREHSFIPNNSARNLKRIEAKTIAVLVKGMTNPFFSHMIRVMEEEIKKKKYSLVLHHVEFDEDEMEVALELIKEKRLCGIIFLGGFFHHAEEKLKQLPVPFVICTSGVVQEPAHQAFYSSISVDDEKESYKMVSYLLEQGHKEIAIIAASEGDASIGKLRLEGYKRAIKERGLTVQEDLIAYMREDLEDYSYENGYEVAKELLARKTSFTAIYVISDVMAVGAARALAEAGKKIPADYALAGFDGIDIGKYYLPSITTIKQPVKEMALEAAKILFEVIMEEAPHRHITFPGELLIRESTGK